MPGSGPARGRCTLCGAQDVLICPVLKPWPRLAEHRTPAGNVCFEGAPADRVMITGAEMCLSGDIFDPECVDCMRMKFQQETGLNAPARGDYAAWYSYFLNTGNEWAQRVMEDAVRPADEPLADIAVKEDALSRQVATETDIEHAVRYATRDAKLFCLTMLIMDGGFFIPTAIVAGKWNSLGPFLIVLGICVTFILANLVAKTKVTVSNARKR